MDTQEGKRARRNPWETTNLLSLLTFAWVWPIFKKGLGKDLDMEDMYETPKVHESEYLTKELSR